MENLGNKTSPCSCWRPRICTDWLCLLQHDPVKQGTQMSTPAHSSMHRHNGSTNTVASIMALWTRSSLTHWHPIWVLVRVLAALLPIQLPAHDLGKAVEDSRSSWACAIYVGDLEAPVSWLWPNPELVVMTLGSEATGKRFSLSLCLPVCLPLSLSPCMCICACLCLSLLPPFSL